MKKLPVEEIILILGAVFFLASFLAFQLIMTPVTENPSGELIGPGCKDSDNGKDLTIRGTVSYYWIGQYHSYTDTCYDSTRVVEVDCDKDGTAKAGLYACSSVSSLGYCENGRCPKAQGDSCSPLGRNAGCLTGYCAKDIGLWIRAACCPPGYCWFYDEKLCYPPSNNPVYNPTDQSMYKCTTTGWRYVGEQLGCSSGIC